MSIAADRQARNTAIMRDVRAQAQRRGLRWYPHKETVPQAGRLVMEPRAWAGIDYVIHVRADSASVDLELNCSKSPRVRAAMEQLVARRADVLAALPQALFPVALKGSTLRIGLPVRTGAEGTDLGTDTSLASDLLDALQALRAALDPIVAQVAEAARLDRLQRQR